MMEYEKKHLIAAKERIENLWLAGTDYDALLTDRSMKENQLIHLDLDLTNECDLKCYYCDRTPDRFDDKDRNPLTTEQRKSVIYQAYKLGAKTVEIPGAGEPSLDPSFWEILEYIHSLDMVPVIFTHGALLDDESIDRLYDLNASIFLKFTTFESKVNDKLVGVKGYTDKAKVVLDKLIAKGFNKSIPTRIAIDMVVSRRHKDEDIAETHRWCRDNNIHHYISTLIPEGMADKRTRQEEWKRSDELLNMIRNIDNQEYGLVYDMSRPMAGGYKCRQVNLGLFVNLYGEVYDCNGLGRPLGSIGEQTLEEVWNSRLAKVIRKHPQDGYCLVRERVWKGVESKGLDRKLKDIPEQWRESQQIAVFNVSD